MNMSLLQLGKIAGLIFIGILLGVIIAGKTNLRIAGVQSDAKLRSCWDWYIDCRIQNPPESQPRCWAQYNMCMGVNE